MMEAFDPIRYINEPRWQESRLGLERISGLLTRMGRPQDRLRFVHVAGTNGKGSTCAYLESALRCAGYATGMFTSPYVMRFEERIRVNGDNIGGGDLADVTLFVREHAEAMACEAGEHPTEFELMCAVAFEHFARSGCDIVVCEVGMGGRLDSTNVIEHPEACVITRIGLDHTAYLGDTTEAVAAEKAGIVKAGAPVVSWPQENAAMEVVSRAARRAGSKVNVPDFSQLSVSPVDGATRSFSYKGESYRTRLLGSYQPFNAALAIEALECLRARGWDVSPDDIRDGIARAVWPGRFEVVSAGPPPLVLDGGHNPQGSSVLADSLADVFPGKGVVFVMSVLADKDYRAMIRAAAPVAKAFVCTAPPNSRALPADALADAVREEWGALDESGGAGSGGAGSGGAPGAGRAQVMSCGRVEDALRTACAYAADEDVICVFGSLYSIASCVDALRADGLPTNRQTDG